ncbi:Protein kinase domain-containing protein [Aphelenchoides fujianensis]|nr:Protein kinase domain-containing protein [Aphelenchoides fujianensis]
MDEQGVVPEAIDFEVGKVVSSRWRVERKLGVGGCGVVYEVRDLQTPSKQSLAALKVETNNQEDGGVLKIEAEVLKRLQDRKHTIRLLQAGKRPDYSFVVLTLCGPDLLKLKETRNLARFSESTTLRLGVLVLYSIKQLHEVGYIHRDIKPGNVTLGWEPRGQSPLLPH